MNQLIVMKKFFVPLLLLLICASCSPLRQQSLKDDGKIEVNFILINDVYEIAPLSGGREGGMARIASLKKEYLKENPNTFLMMAGDFLSPSVYNSLQHEGKPIRGRQMIEAMNAAGVNFATFGNHEFDIRENELQDRIDESAFQWISTNVMQKHEDMLHPFIRKNSGPIPQTITLTVSDKDGTTARIGIITACLPFNRAEYVHYEDPVATAKKFYNQLKDTVDAVVAFTHQSIEEDKRLARELPGLAFIIGGHEHDQRFEKTGDVYIVKAMSNAKSAYVVELEINTRKRKLDVEPELEVINEKIALDSATNRVVQKWTNIADKSFSALGFDADRIVIQSGEPLEGRESMVRTRPTNLSGLIIKGMQQASPKATVTIFNSGSIRVDDVLHMPVTEYDMIRTLPFGGGIREVDMKGSLLIKTLDQGMKNRGSGGYLLFNENLRQDAQGWWLDNKPLDPQRTYRVALSEFLLTGKEANLDFLTEQNPEIIKVYPAPVKGSAAADVRIALIQYLRKD